MHARSLIQDATVGVAVADRPEDLSSFLEPGCAAAIWRRQPAPEFQNWIDTLEPFLLPQGRLTMCPEAAPTAVQSLCDLGQTPRCAGRDQLVEDICKLAKIFATLMQTSYLRLRLQAVTTDACRKFHTDAVTARLVCTYRGQGTQYGVSTDGRDPERIFSVATGAPLLLRGTLWPESPSSGLLHRSPPIEETGETRLVLVLDPVEHPEDEI